MFTLRNLGPIEYRCNLLDRYGQLVWRYRIFVSNDDEAISMARGFFGQRRTSVSGFELWQDGRYIHCENDAGVFDLMEERVTPNLLPHRFLAWPPRALARRSRYV